MVGHPFSKEGEFLDAREGSLRLRSAAPWSLGRLGRSRAFLASCALSLGGWAALFWVPAAAWPAGLSPTTLQLVLAAATLLQLWVLNQVLMD